MEIKWFLLPDITYKIRLIFWGFGSDIYVTLYFFFSKFTYT